MKNAFPLVIVLLLCSCIAGPNFMWGSLRRAQIVPVSPGISLFSDQDIYGMINPSGKTIWEKEIEGAKRVRCKIFGDSFLALGDTRLIIRFDNSGKDIWKYIVTDEAGVWPIQKFSDILVLAYDSDTKQISNPIILIGISVKTGEEIWRLEDQNYSGILILPDFHFESNVLVVPTILGDSVWFDGLRISDRVYIWRAFWGLPKPGQPIILSQDEERLWILRANDKDVETAVLMREDGKIIGKTKSRFDQIIQVSNISENVYIRFKYSIKSLNKKGILEDFDKSYFPVCQIPGDNNNVVVTNEDCGLFKLNMKTKKSERIYSSQSCYRAIAGKMRGEIYLTPTEASYDYKSFRYTLLTPQEAAITEIPSVLRDLGVSKSFYDLYYLIEKIKR